ncbi:MAG TPA: DUF1638 domain-containing protein [Methanomassiliicoccales archaeon]|jgi:hypothetical protein
MRIGVIACDMLRKEFEILVKDDPDIVHVEYLDFSLHADPKMLKSTIEEKVNALEGKVDAVLLGYGMCKGLKNIEKRLSLPTVMLEGDDCVDILLPPEEYAKELKKCAGTWFAIPAIAERHEEYINKTLNLDSYDNEEYDANFILNMVFENYSRCLFIDTGVEGRKECKQKSIEFAQSHNLRHDTRCGSIVGIYLGLEKAKTLAECITTLDSIWGFEKDEKGVRPDDSGDDPSNGPS